MINIGGWQFLTWNFQYLIGFIISLIISIYVYSKSRTSKVTRIFLFYGASVMAWNLIVFVHRSAPTAFVSHISFRLSSSFGFIMFGLISLMLLFMYKKDLKNLLMLIPSFVISSAVILYGPFEVVMTNYGWNYEPYSWFLYLVATNLIFYIVATSVIGIWIIKKIRSTTIKLKIKIILFATVIVYFVGILSTNVILVLYPQSPSFGGLITTLQFLFIAYAISIKEKEIAPFEDNKRPFTKLSESYLAFLNKFHSEIPGKELGESTFRFDDYLEAIGLSGIISYKEGELIFEQDELDHIKIKNIPDTILRVIKKLSWAKNLEEEYKNLFLITYEWIEKYSEPEALRWTDNIMKIHGPYIYHNGILDEISERVEVSGIYKKLPPGSIRLFKEKEPKKLCELAEEAGKGGYDVLYLSKYRHTNIHDQGEDNIKLKFRDDPSKMLVHRIYSNSSVSKKNISPKNMKKLDEVISDFIDDNYMGIVVIDSLDQILSSNGIDNTLRFLKKIVSIIKNEGSILLVSVDLDLFARSEWKKIEKVLQR